MIRTRFAPSPTGYLHIGGVRTALFSWLFARHHHGKFILRIEDTDRERSTPEKTNAILEGLAWLGLDYDEGPYFQSERNDHYQTVLKKLIETGHAYPCYCTADRLQALRENQLAHKQKPRYDRNCRDQIFNRAKEGNFVIRFKNPIDGIVTVEDKILGKVTFNNEELDDFILARSDGSPTYNFTVVADDYDMGITHVIRGNDHLNNTPRQINVLKALGAPIPTYMHLPMIHSETGKKLSKREGAANVIDYREAGFLPEALINYLVRLGWSHGDQEIFSREELVKYFDGQHLSKSPAVLNQQKLLWLNQHYLKQMDPHRISELMIPFTAAWPQHHQDAPALSEVVAIQRERVKTLKEMTEKSAFFYIEPNNPLPPLSTELSAVIELLYTRLEKMQSWDKISIYHTLRQIIELYHLKPSQLFQTLRPILTGSEVSPPIDCTIQLLGKSQVLHRLKRAITAK